MSGTQAQRTRFPPRPVSSTGVTGRPDNTKGRKSDDGDRGLVVRP
jgi:hypothetical protein